MAVKVEGITIQQLRDALDAIVNINERASRNSRDGQISTLYKEIARTYREAKLTELK